MNKLETSQLPEFELNQKTEENNDDLLEYCHICFIALGSQEKRIYIKKNAVHPDCAKKAKSK